MFKLLEFDGYDQHGPHIFPLELGGGNRHVKLATEMHPEIARYIANAKKIPGKTQLLIDALGAGEWWGANRNGDVFFRDQLDHPGKDYGYETFVHYGNVFKHHVNKDPTRAYGNIILSVYNPSMHRVQLVVAVHDEKCRDILDGIDNGKYSDVSMGTRVPFDVCFPDGTLVKTSEGYKNISNIEAGDFVLTHNRSYKKVTRTFKRKSGDIVSIGCAFFSKPVPVTGNHPFLAIRKQDLRSCIGSANGEKLRHKCVRGICSRCKRQINIEPEWVPASDLSIGDYLAHPIQESDKIDVDVNFARLCGYYIGDGSRIRQRRGRKRNGDYALQGLQFSCGVHEEDHVEKIISTIVEAGAKNEPKAYKYESKNEISVRIYDKDLAKKVIDTCGVVRSKHLPFDVESWNRDSRLSLLGGLIDTDGSQDHGRRKGFIRFISTIKELSEQTRDLCLSLGIPVSLGEQTQKTTYGESTAYNVCIPASQSGLISKYSNKVKPYDSTLRSKTIVEDNYAFTPISKIEAGPGEDSDVYNLSVESDESYVIHGVSVHNCSICTNHAKNRSQYCEHLKYQMNRILPDGRKVMAINHRPKFFDISFVLIGAEKASKVLMKVASQNRGTVSSAELGERYYGRKFWKGADLKSAAVQKKGTITKEVPMKVDSIKPVVESAPVIKSREPELPPAVMKLLAGFPLSEIFSTLSFLGIDPKPEEFQKIVLVKSGQSKLAHDLEARGVVFREDQSATVDDPEQYFSIGPEYINEKIANALRPAIPHRSCFNDFLISRLDKYASENPWYPDEKKSTYLPAIPLAAGLAGLYAYAKDKSAEASMTKFEKAMLRHPWLFGLLTAAGAGVLAGGINLLRPQPLGSLDTQFGTGYNPHYKTAASKKWLIPLSLGPLAYMYSGVQRSRAMRGERLGKFDRFVAERPDIAAIASMIGAPLAASKGASLARHLKLGSVYSDFGLFSLTSGSKLLPAALIGAMVDATVAKKIGKIIDKRSKHGNPEGPA